MVSKSRQSFRRILWVLTGVASLFLMLPQAGLAAGPVVNRKLLTSSFDGEPQWVYYQIPEVCTTGHAPGGPAPLIIGVHGYGNDGKESREFLAAEADERGWLVAAPDMHNRVGVGGNKFRRGKRAFAWLGAQHDIIDTIESMKTNPDSVCGVDLSRIYIAGGSMGGQTTSVMAAKYPDVFAAAAFWKPITHLAEWHGELIDPNLKLDLEVEAGGTPATAPFEYERRSSREMAQNMRLVPIKIWHDVDDLLVPVHHSPKLVTAINAWSPPIAPVYVEIPANSNSCPDSFQHCFKPDLGDLFDFLSSYSRNTSTLPPFLSIRTDESKPYYWLKIQQLQSAGEHWTEVQATYQSSSQTLTATVSDSKPLALGFNFGSSDSSGPAGVPQPGLGLPSQTYQVTAGGDNVFSYSQNYTADYFTVTLNTPGHTTITIAPKPSPGDDPEYLTYLPAIIK